MDKEYESIYHLSEEKNWWFVARRNSIKVLLKSTPRHARILDIGCGGGALALDLQNEGFINVVSVDFSDAAVQICKQRGLKDAYQMDAHKIEFENESFDIIIASDILEHLEKDKEALLDWNRVLKPNGLMHIFVPAYQFLWSNHDVINHHFRRYTKKNLKQKLEAAGFEISNLSYWNFTLFFPTAIIRLLEKVLPKKDAEKEGQIVHPPKLINAILIKLLAVENAFFIRTGFPLGVSAYASVNKSKN
jgi:SAM-dependent methyltransferase